MKITIFFIFALMLVQCGSRGTKVKDGDVHKCVLLESYTGFLTCGVFAEATAMKFNLQEQNTDIAVVIRCPNAFDSGYFSKDQKYKITLTSDSSICKGYRVYNNYPGLPMYYALNVAKIN